MNIILIILVILAVIIAIPLLIALFTKKEYTVEREITINKPRQEVFNYVKYQRNQDHYSKWVMGDPAAKKEFRGTDGTVGFVYAWDSENKQVGQGEQEIKRIADGERIELEIRFKKPFEGIGKTHMVTAPSTEGQTRVTWGMRGTSKYPFNLMNLFIDKLLGKDLETSLTNLKVILEKERFDV